jgi:hypothetical protein
MVAVKHNSLLSGQYSATESGRENSWRIPFKVSSCSVTKDLVPIIGALITGDETVEFILIIIGIKLVYTGTGV